VVVNGKLVFSKAQTGRFPVEGEVEDLLALLKNPASGSPTAASGEESADKNESAGRAGVIRRLGDRFRN
jgi:hypothetical protein